MSTELAVAIIGLTGVAIPSGVEIWKARRRKGEPRTPPPPATAQPLREDAVELLSELIMTPMPLHPHDEARIESAFEGVKARRNKLINLRSRLAVNNGISEEEVTAFSDAATAGMQLGEAVCLLMLEHDNGKSDALDEKMAAIDRAREDFHEAALRFELVAREAARAG